MMCSLVVIEVCILPSCGRWSHCVPSVRETLERMRIDGLVCKKVTITARLFMVRPILSVREAVHSCLMEQHCVTAFNYELSFPFFLSLLSAGWRKRRLRTKLRQSSRKRRLSAWKQRKEIIMSSRNRYVGPVFRFFDTAQQWCVLIWKPLHYPFISNSFPFDLIQ